MIAWPTHIVAAAGYVFDKNGNMLLVKTNTRGWDCTGGYDGNVPIIEFGRHEYGDLSYTIGAICLYKLSDFVGVEIFEKATRIFFIR